MIQESVNKTADKKLWDKEIQREMAEHRERHFANREVEIKKYEQDLQIWKDVNRKYIRLYHAFFTIFKLKYLNCFIYAILLPKKSVSC